jgi:hypothetical protein
VQDGDALGAQRFRVHAEGFTSADLRERVGALYELEPNGYTAQRMTYDLRRLRLRCLIGFQHPPVHVTPQSDWRIHGIHLA